MEDTNLTQPAARNNESTRRVALVHEWLATWGGSESVLQSLTDVYPEAPIFTLLYRPDARTREVFRGRSVTSTSLGLLPFVERYYRLLLPLMPSAWGGLSIGDFDVVISSSHSMAKSVDTGAAHHICYCHTPPRYLWDLNEEYRSGPATLLKGSVLDRLRDSDLDAARSVDTFVANSAFVAERIRRIYGRESTVVHPPVAVDTFPAGPSEGRYFLAGGRLVSYKRIDRAILAANKARLPLVVFGAGPERSRLEAMAGPSVRFTGAVSHDGLTELFRDAVAFVYPGVEDFGILPVEAQAAGRPVIALGVGGAQETVRDRETGILYLEDSVDGLIEALEVAARTEWSWTACRINAERFSRAHFERRMTDVVAGATGSIEKSPTDV